MRITEYENRDLSIAPPPMLCDKPICDGIKEPLPSTHHFASFIGIPGRGKTSLAMSLLTHPDGYHKKFNNIFVVMPKNSRESIAGNPFKKHPAEKLFDELELSVLEFVHEYTKVESSEGHSSLLILDDCTAQLKNGDVQRMLKTLIFNRRHLKLSIWICSQGYNQMPLAIRKTITHAFVFKPANKKELENIFSELIFLPKEQVEGVTRHIFDSPHNFMLLDTNRTKIHKNFNLLELQE
jgi:hypothetical protein